MTNHDLAIIKIDSSKFEVLTLTHGEYSDYQIIGTFIVPVDMDWNKHMELFTIKRYGEEAEKKSDVVILNETEFISWLQDQKLIKPVAICEKHIELPVPDIPYEPAHWPICPVCNNGRGEPEHNMGRYHIIGEITRYHRCTSCSHEWGHHTEQTKR